MSNQTSADKATHRVQPSSQYTSAALTSSRKGIPIPNLVTPEPHVPDWPQPGHALPMATTAPLAEDISLRPRRSSDGSGAHGSKEASEASDDGEVIDDDTETGSDDGLVIDDDPPTDEEEVGESDSEEALKPSSSIKPQPGAAKAAEHGLDPSTFSGVRLLAPADIKVGNYLASGAFGDVFRGRWNYEDVALKQIDIKQAAQRLELSEQDVLEAIQWEVSRMSTVRHPNLVEFHGVCFKGDAIYLVMEFCNQGSLQKVLESQRVKQAVPMSRLWQWMLEIAEGLAYLHSQGVVHRDLKADNILIDKNGRAKLADLGVAQVDALLQESEAKPVAQGMQDKLFVAPDSGGNSSSKESDVYALGLVFWQMLSHGAAPDSWSDMLAQDPELKELKAGRRMPIPEECPEPIRKLILSCWHAKAAQRASIEQLIQALHDMGPELRGDHGLLLLAEHMEQLLHGSREEIRNQVPPLVTRRPVEGSYEAHWKSQAKASTTATTTTTTTTTAATTTTTTTSSASITTTTTAATPTTATTTVTPPKAANTKRSLSADQINPALDLKTIIDDFIAEPGPGSLLLLGEGGMGKSLSVRALATRVQQQWWDYFADPRTHARPPCAVLDLRSHLKSWSLADLKSAVANLIKQYGLRYAKTKLLVVVDGYDECGLTKGEAADLGRHLELPKDAKLLITCRPDALPQEQWKRSFGWGDKLQQCHCLPFNADQMLDYLKTHLDWDETAHARYQAAVQSSPGLRSVIGNPFLLYLLSQSWSTVSKKNLKGLTRSDIYAGFIEHTVNAGSDFLAGDVRKQLQGGHPDLAASFEAFAQAIAIQAFKGKSSALPQSEVDKLGMTWDQAPDLVRQEARQRYREREARQQDKRRLVLTQADFEIMRMQAANRLLDTLPLRTRGNSWEFMHKSLWEYCAAQFLLKLCADEAIAMDEGKLRELMLWARDSSPEVLMFLREALEAAEKNPTLSDDKANAAFVRRSRLNEVVLRNGIGEVLHIRENFVQALAYFKQALTLRIAVPGPEDLTLADSYHNIAISQNLQCNYQEALDNMQKAIAILKKVLDPTQEDTAHAHSTIAVILHNMGRDKEALTHFQLAQAACEMASVADVPFVCSIQLNIAELADDFDQANGHLDKAMAAAVSLGREYELVADVHDSRGRSLCLQENYEEALEEHRLALAMRKRNLHEGHSKFAESHVFLGLTLGRQGKFDEAMAHFETALRLQAKVLGADHIRTANTYACMADLCTRNGKYAMGIEMLQEELRIRKKLLDPGHPDVARIHGSIGAIMHLQEKFDEALKYFNTGLKLSTAWHGPDHFEVGKCHERVGVALYDLERDQEALEHYKTAWRILIQCHRVDDAASCADMIKAIENNLSSSLSSAKPDRRSPASQALQAAKGKRTDETRVSIEEASSGVEEDSCRMDCRKVCVLV